MPKSDLAKEELDVYTTIENAKKEIVKRWNDKDLKKKVEEYLGGDIPKGFLNEPRAVLFRNIASPDLEFLYFLKMAKDNGMKPLVLEYTHDKFSTRNADKLCLAKLAIFEGKNKNGEAIVRYRKLIDIKVQDNKEFCEIETLEGENLVEFHHNLVTKMVPEGVDVFGMSQWIEHNGKTAAEYYNKFLALFVCHGILFENFVTDESEAEFEDMVVIPALENVKKIFSVEPIICPLASDPNDMYWWSYPSEIEKILEKTDVVNTANNFTI